MFILQDGITEIVLSNPVVDNSTEALAVRALYKRAMDGSFFSHKRSSSRRVYNWTFAKVSVDVINQIIAFITLNKAKTVSVRTEDDEFIVGTLRDTTVSFTFDTDDKAKGPLGTFQIILEG